MINTWAELAELRRNGKKPALRIIVTDKKRMCWNLHGVGCMTILHGPGEPMPVELLEGLDVILWFANCERAALVWRAMRAKEIAPARCEAWCECSRELTNCVGKCTDIWEVDDLIGAISASK